MCLLSMRQHILLSESSPHSKRLSVQGIFLDILEARNHSTPSRRDIRLS